MKEEKPFVEYESFGAAGDGVTDDLPAICRAHDYANETGLPVRSTPGVTYHLGYRALTARIGTSTDWNTSRFTIDDSDLDRIENHDASLFEVISLLEPLGLELTSLARDQDRCDLRPATDCFVRVEQEGRRLYIRRGLNRNAGVPQHDTFIIRTTGSIEGPVDWDYGEISAVEVRPIDPEQLVVEGGVFTTLANRMEQPEGYNYWSRNIRVTRSNTQVRGLTHSIAGETSVGHPYGGFLNIHRCADIVLRDCFLSGHRIYKTIGAAGKPVPMGSYDIVADDVVNFTMTGCRMNHINDRSRWGVIGSNFCKNILLDDCMLSRMDTHMGVSGGYAIRNSTLGHMGLNAIGRGRLVVENSTLYGENFINFRSDYGSTWDGTVEIRDCTWVPAFGDRVWPHLIGVENDGTHDFGYPCSMPEEVHIHGLHVDDTNHPDDYSGMFIFTEHDAAGSQTAAVRPFPYRLARRVVARGVVTASGMPIRLSPDDSVAEAVEVVVME